MSDAWMFPNVPALGGGAWFNPGTSGLQNAQNQYAQNQNYFGNQAATMHAAQVPQNQLYGGGGFGAQPAAYAALGAAYGRGTGGFNAVNGVTQPVGTPGRPSSIGGGEAPPANVDVDSSPFDTGNAGAVPYLSGGGMPFGGGGFGRPPTVFDRGATGIDISGGGAPFGGGGFSPGGQPPMAFNLPSSSPAGGRSFIEPDIASSPGQIAIPNLQRLLGYNPAQSASFAPGGGDNFQSRFGMGFRNAGTPNQYTTSPYTDASGTTHQPNIPPGYQSLFSADNPRGALPGGGFRGIGPGIMNEDWDPDDSADTLRPGDRTAPGGFYGSAFDPAQFQPRGGAGGMGSVAAFNTYGLPGGGGMGAFGGRGGGLTTGMGTIGGPAGGIGSDMLRGGQNQPYAQPWHSLIPGGTPNTPEIIKQINYTAGRGRYDPEAFANVINTESRWNPRTHNDKYYGATQMGADTFKEAGGRLGGMSFGQYQDAPLEQQIPAYGDWLQHYAQPNNAAGLATSGIRGPASVDAIRDHARHAIQPERGPAGYCELAGGARGRQHEYINLAE